MGFIKDWNEFWFKPISTRPIALYRILIGIVALCWCALISPDLAQWYSSSGVYPMAALSLRNETNIGLDVLRHANQMWEIYLAFGVLVVAALGFTIGFWTRASSILLFVMFVSFHDRNSIILNSGDTFLRIAIFLMMFSAGGEYLSVDRWMKVREGLARAHEIPFAEPWAQRLIQLQVSIVYLFTVLAKGTGNLWLNGTAVYYPLHMSELARFPLPLLFDNVLVINLMTYGAMLIEASLATLVWIPRLTKYVLIAGVMLHLGIEYSINIPLFSAIMCASYVTFFEDAWAAKFIDIGSRFLRSRATTDTPSPVLSPALSSIADELVPDTNEAVPNERETVDAK